MVEDNTNQRDSILPSERGAALKMQLEAIKRQGARDGDWESVSFDDRLLTTDSMVSVIRAMQGNIQIEWKI